MADVFWNGLGAINWNRPCSTWAFNNSTCIFVRQRRPSSAAILLQDLLGPLQAAVWSAAHNVQFAVACSRQGATSVHMRWLDSFMRLRN